MSSTSRQGAQHAILVQGCGLLDRSDRGKLALTGADAAQFLHGQVTNDVVSLRPGEGCYAAFLTHKGKMLGDLRILATQDELLLDTERVALQPLFDLIMRFKIGHQVQLHKRTLQCALLSLIGPQAGEVLGAAIDEAHLPSHLQKEHAHAEVTIGSRPVRLIATAQPPGVDLLLAAQDAQRVAQALLAAGAQPVSEQAAEILRIEAGRPRFGIDIGQDVIPQEAGLNERAVSFTKGCYVGQETVARLHYKGRPNRHLRGLLLDQPLPAGTPLQLQGRIVGRLGSSAVSPSLGPIGLALLRREAEPASRVSDPVSGVGAQVVELPFQAPAADRPAPGADRAAPHRRSRSPRPRR